ncbi:flagellar hook assembly protein FlgD [Haloarcula laminariae]|uniref:hypothetical protein n=1 Tax=Haloarcula laminariae TaxID=2961577 RepID=UPI002405ABAE|nr:hypothetical protein [Halomicroarcula sp. FL173]
MERRRFLAGSSGVLTTVVAGCSGGEDTTAPDDDDGDDGDTDGEGDTPTGTSGEADGTPDSDERETTTGEPSTLDQLSVAWDPYVGDPVSLSGEGDTEETFTLDSGFTAIDYDFSGYELFARLLDSDGNLVRVINELNGIGGVDGVPVESGEYTFEIEADGEWSIELGSPEASSETLQRPPASVSGLRNDVVGPVEISGGETIAVTHDGEGDFIVDSVLEDGTGDADVEGVADEFSGPYEDETTLSEPGIRWFPVYASGAWEIDIE